MGRYSNRSWIGAALGLLILALLGLALLSGGCRGLLVSWFGPPEVEMSETYADVEGAATFDHSAFDELLGAYVDADGFVDYAGLADRAGRLDAYIDSLATAPFDELGRDARLALLVNAYNAFTLRLILDHYPLDSIKDIPAGERWEAERWEIAGSVHSLNQIEHQLIRPNFREPRVHFALVCAAIGCPTLRTEAYTGERLEEQLEEQARYTHAQDRWMRYRPGAETVELTSLYAWYRDDFVQVAGSILAYAARYHEDLARDLERGHRPRIEFLDYDWGLNER